MRHATDADHVVAAVSTIVSRERRIWSAALIGALWGAGHTITILAVGASIILFTLVIPPRVGLSMEFSVGLMLVLLGVLNLRGFGREVQRSWLKKDERTGTEGNVHRHSMVDGGHIHELSDAPVDFMDRKFGGWSVYQWARPLIVGLAAWTGGISRSGVAFGVDYVA